MPPCLCMLLCLCLSVFLSLPWWSPVIPVFHFLSTPTFHDITERKHLNQKFCSVLLLRNSKKHSIISNIVTNSHYKWTKMKDMTPWKSKIITRYKWTRAYDGPHCVLPLSAVYVIQNFRLHIIITKHLNLSPNFFITHCLVLIYYYRIQAFVQ